jgi:multiple sugar transport system substrate-binding protein
MLVAACGSSSSSTPSSSPSGDIYTGSIPANTTITVEVTSSPSDTALRALAPQFTAATGIKVNFVEVPYTDVATKILLASKEGTSQFDVVQFDSPMMAPLAAGHALANLGPPANASAAYDAADFSPQVQNYAKYNGVSYSLPLSTEPYILWYNTALFKKLHLQVPTTWAQYLANAKICHAAGYYGSDFGYGSAIGAAHWLQVLYSYGGEMWNSSYVPQFTSAQSVAATKMAMSLVPYTPKTAINGDGDEADTAFNQGNVCQEVNATGYYSIMASPKSSKVYNDIGHALPPQANGAHATLLFGWLIGITRNSAHPAAAWKYLEWNLGRANAANYVSQGAPPPARISSLGNPAIVKNLPYLPTQVAASKIAVQLPYIPEMNQIYTVLSNNLNNMATGRWSVQQGLQADNAAVTQIFKTSGRVS